MDPESEPAAAALNALGMRRAGAVETAGWDPYAVNVKLLRSGGDDPRHDFRGIMLPLRPLKPSANARASERSLGPAVNRRPIGADSTLTQLGLRLR